VKSTSGRTAKAKSTRTGSARRTQRAKTSGAASRRGQDAVSLLKADHREVDELVQRYERARSDRKEAIARQICLALTVHAQLEEEMLYPAAREVLGENDADLVDEADVEHATIKRLVSEVERSSPKDSLYDAKVKVIGEYVKHHVREEEKELFPKLQASELDLKALGEQLVARKAALMGGLQRAA
jgi:hemerythrin superfamily protein